jgi:general stress protein YciG
MATNNQDDKEGSKQSGSSNRGFASMDPERQREIASEGGKAAHEKGTAHEFTSDEARKAGSMSHGNKQSDQARSNVGTSGGSKQGGGLGGSKQSDQGGSRSSTESDRDRTSKSDKSR